MKPVPIGQANNAALYPELGFGVIVSRASMVSDEMLLAATEAVAGQATDVSPGFGCGDCSKR